MEASRAIGFRASQSPKSRMKSLLVSSVLVCILSFVVLARAEVKVEEGGEFEKKLRISNRAKFSPMHACIWLTGVRIRMPIGYRDKKMDFALSDFGRARYGSSMLGQVVYPSEDSSYWPATARPPRCKTDPKANYACTSLSECEFTALSPPMKKPGSRYIMLIDRGPPEFTCYFVTKVYHAQEAGADAVLVVNDKPGEANLTTAIPPEEEVWQELAASIKISAGMISKESGDLIKGLMVGGKPVMLSISWETSIPTKDKINWEMWLSTNTGEACGEACQESIALVSNLKNAAVTLAETGSSFFTPHYFLFSCPEEYVGSDDCKSMCVMNGRYCSDDPDDDYDSGYSGIDVLFMNAVHACFFRLVNASGRQDLWWEFSKTFSTACSMRSKMYDLNCAKTLFNDLRAGELQGGTGLKVWQDCIPGTITPAYVGSNGTIPLLEEELSSQMGTNGYNPVFEMPSVRIDGTNYRGSR